MRRRCSTRTRRLRARVARALQRAGRDIASIGVQVPGKRGPGPRAARWRSAAASSASRAVTRRDSMWVSRSPGSARSTSDTVDRARNLLGKRQSVELNVERRQAGRRRAESLHRRRQPARCASARPASDRADRLNRLGTDRLADEKLPRLDDEQGQGRRAARGADDDRRSCVERRHAPGCRCRERRHSLPPPQATGERRASSRPSRCGERRVLARARRPPERRIADRALERWRTAVARARPLRTPPRRRGVAFQLSRRALHRLRIEQAAIPSKIETPPPRRRRWYPGRSGSEVGSP